MDTITAVWVVIKDWGGGLFSGLDFWHKSLILSLTVLGWLLYLNIKGRLNDKVKNIHLEVETKQLIKEKSMMQELRSLLESQRLETQAGFQVIGTKIDAIRTELVASIDATRTELVGSIDKNRVELDGKIATEIGKVNDNLRTLRSDMLVIKGDVGEIKGAMEVLKKLEKS